MEIENTHNRGGGLVVPQPDVARICAAARERGIASYCDGARLWNAAVASGATPSALAAPFDLVGVALSKGLGAPMGSVLAGTRAHIDRATRYRRMLGGALRQSGIVAAAGVVRPRPPHGAARRRSRQCAADRRRLAQCPGVLLDLATVATNIVVFRLAADAPDAATVVARARERGVLIFPFAPRTVRFVTHLDVTTTQCEAAAAILAAAIAG